MNEFDNSGTSHKSESRLEMAQLVRGWRQQWRLTQKQCADKVGVSRETWSRIERGCRDISGATLLEFMKATNAKIDFELPSDHRPPHQPMVQRREFDFNIEYPALARAFGFRFLSIKKRERFDEERIPAWARPVVQALTFVHMVAIFTSIIYLWRFRSVDIDPSSPAGMVFMGFTDRISRVACPAIHIFGANVDMEVPGRNNPTFRKVKQFCGDVRPRITLHALIRSWGGGDDASCCMSQTVSSYSRYL